MTKRAGKILGVALVLALAAPVAAGAQELSEKAVKSFMDYAWSLTPQQFSKPDGKTIQIDKKKRDEVMVPLDVAREVIKVGRLSAHAQVCGLQDHQTANHHSMMAREMAKKKWSEQQLVFISQLHLTTVMLLTGKIRLVEKDGDKEVVVEEEKKSAAQTCTDEQRAKVKDMIVEYTKASPGVTVKTVDDVPESTTPAAAAPQAAAAPAAGAAPAAAAPAAAAAKPAAAAPATAKAETTTGSTAAPAAKSAPAAAPAAKAPAPAPAEKK